MQYIDFFVKPPYEGWRPYCLVCPTIDRMTPTDFGWRCGSCGNPIGKDGKHWNGLQGTKMSASKGKREALTLRFPPALANRVKAIAKSHGITVNDMLVELFEKAVRRSEAAGPDLTPIRVNVILPAHLISRIDTVTTNRSRFLADAAEAKLEKEKSI